jgi:hypothetical protein
MCSKKVYRIGPRRKCFIKFYSSVALQTEKARVFVYNKHIQASLTFAGKVWSGVPARWSTWEGSIFTGKYMTKQKMLARDKLLRFRDKKFFCISIDI